MGKIKVIAENGESKSYIVTITRKEKDPIEVTINKKKYTVAKKEIGLKIPEGFVKTKVVIDKQEVVAYSNSFTGYLIVALVYEDGNASWYIYSEKNGTYECEGVKISNGTITYSYLPTPSLNHSNYTGYISGKYLIAYQ